VTLACATRCTSLRWLMLHILRAPLAELLLTLRVLLMTSLAAA
jgi:hypothetical protein